MAMTYTTARPTTVRVADRPTDEVADLTRRAAAGDAAAWDELVRRFSDMVWGITRSYRLADSDAADVFQTTWLRLVEHIGALSEPRGVGAWLGTTARRECTRVIRAGRRQVPAGDDLPEPAADPADVDAMLLRAERDAILWEAFSALRPSDQALLRMLVADPAPSYDDVSAALAIPRGSIGPTRRRCLERLRRSCEPHLGMRA